MNRRTRKSARSLLTGWIDCLRGPELSRGRLLFALFESGLPSESLLGASAICSALDYQLDLLYVRPTTPRMKTLVPALDLYDGARAARATSRAVNSRQSWISRRLGAAAPAVQLKTGSFVPVVARYARETMARLIVLPPNDAAMGALVVKLVSAARVPVLVLRSALGWEPIIAGTDLVDTENRVLRAAANLGEWLDAPLVAVHRVGVARRSTETRDPTPVQDAVVEARAYRLARATERVGFDGENLVVRDPSAVESILREARARAAGLIVVGTHSKSLERSVAREVVDRARRSVLVVPLGPRSTKSRWDTS